MSFCEAGPISNGITVGFDGRFWIAKLCLEISQVVPRNSMLWITRHHELQLCHRFPEASLPFQRECEVRTGIVGIPLPKGTSIGRFRFFELALGRARNRLRECLEAKGMKA